MTAYRDLVAGELQRLAVPLAGEQIDLLAAYCVELDRWNQRMNLTGLQGSELVRRLVAEPVWIAAQLRPGGRLVDIGSGNGSPAIPIHIVSSFSKTYLVEARLKRAAFLRHIVAALGLKGLEVYKGRFEAFAENAPQTDWVTLQAVALTSDLLEGIRSMARPEISVAWITSGEPPPIPYQHRLAVPGSRTEVWILSLRQK